MHLNPDYSHLSPDFRQVNRSGSTLAHQMLQAARPKKSNTSSPTIELSSKSEEASLVESSSVASSTGSNATRGPVALDLDDPVVFSKLV